MYGDVSGAAISVKFDVNDKIAVGFAQYNQAGIDLAIKEQVLKFQALMPLGQWWIYKLTLWQ